MEAAHLKRRIISIRLHMALHPTRQSSYFRGFPPFAPLLFSVKCTVNISMTWWVNNNELWEMMLSHGNKWLPGHSHDLVIAYDLPHSWRLVTHEFHGWSLQVRSHSKLATEGTTVGTTAFKNGSKLKRCDINKLLVPCQLLLRDHLKDYTGNTG